MDNSDKNKAKKQFGENAGLLGNIPMAEASFDEKISLGDSGEYEAIPADKFLAQVDEEIQENKITRYRDDFPLNRT